MNEERGPDHREALEATWERLKRISERLDRHFCISQKLERGKQYAIEHPVVTMFALITLVFCSVPLLCFIGFALTTFLVTFIGFLFVEGKFNINRKTWTHIVYLFSSHYESYIYSEASMRLIHSYLLPGFLLTIGTVFLGGILCIVGILSLGVGTFVALAWLSARAGHRLIGQIKNTARMQGRPPQPIVATDLNGECVKDSSREKDE